MNYKILMRVCDKLYEPLTFEQKQKLLSLLKNGIIDISKKEKSKMDKRYHISKTK